MVLISEEAGFKVLSVRTKTGAVNRDLPVASLKWSLPLGGPGTITVTLATDSEEVQTLELRSLTTAVRDALAVQYTSPAGTFILECGPIWKRRYKPENETLELEASGLRSIFERRKNVPGAQLTAFGTPMTSEIVITNKTLGSIARELVRISIQDNAQAMGQLNIVLPADVAGTHDRTYHGYDLQWIDDQLRELSGVTNGPDIRFRPRFNASNPALVEWPMEYGTEADPLLHQAGDDWVWDTDAPDSAVVGLGLEEDATGLGCYAWVPGNGQERDMVLGEALDITLADLGWPWLEREDSTHKTNGDQADLDDYATRLQADSLYPWNQWRLTVRADLPPYLGEYQPGDWAQITVGAGHPEIPQGTYRVRIMGMEGDESQNVEIIVAPMQGTIL
jgi:hypothetical protein